MNIDRALLYWKQDGVQLNNRDFKHPHVLNLFSVLAASNFIKTEIILDDVKLNYIYSII